MKMKAVGFEKSLPIDNPAALQDIELDTPPVGGRDLLVKIAAIAVNPVDYKVRQNMPPESGYRVLGWDAVGEVVATGDQVEKFALGDRIYYAGDLTRQGSNAEYQLVDERIVGCKPESLSDTEAAALPLTTITAWELLFDHLQLQRQTPEGASNDSVLLIMGAAGGVGSILTQIARQLTGATVIGTASRPQSRAWVESLGAHHVVDHTKPLQAQLKTLGFSGVTHVASLVGTEQHFDELAEVLLPFGKLALIDDPGALDIGKLKRKSLSLHWEFMFTRSMFQTVDMAEQSILLNEVARLVDAGQIKTTLGEHFGSINAENLRRAHAKLESGTAIGKIVLQGF